MRLSAWLWLVARGLLAQPGRVTLTVASAALSCALAGMALGALLYVRTEVEPQLLTLFPENRLVVRPPDLDVSILKLQLATINDDTVARIGAVPGVVDVHPQLSAEFPLMAEIRIGRLDAEFASDVVMLGVPRSLIAKDLPPLEPFAWSPGSSEPVPVAVSAYFLDLYNLGLAESAGLPKLSAKAAMGREFDLLLGESTLGLTSTHESRLVRAKIVGLTTNPLLVGLCAPIDVVRSWNREFTGGKPTRYAVLHVDASDPRVAVDVRESIRAMGFRVDSTADDLARFQEMLGTLEGALVAVAAVVIGLTIVGIVATVAMSTRERRAPWGLARATGLRPGHVLALVWWESLVQAVLAATIGFGVLAGAMELLRRGFGDLAASLSLLPGDPFAVGATHAAIVWALAVLLVAVPNLLFTLPAATAQPIRLLARRGI